jgi:hypothetical protein
MRTFSQITAWKTGVTVNGGVGFSYRKGCCTLQLIWYSADAKHFIANFTFMWPCIVTNFPVIKPTRCTNFSNLLWKWNSTYLGQFLCPSSGVIHCTLSNGICHTGLQTAFEQDQYGTTTYTIAECTVNNSWWWTEELSETCRVSFPK